MDVVDLVHDRFVESKLKRMPPLKSEALVKVAARHEIDFLKAVDERGQFFYEQEFLERAVIRCVYARNARIHCANALFSFKFVHTILRALALMFYARESGWPMITVCTFTCISVLVSISR